MADQLASQRRSSGILALGVQLFLRGPDALRMSLDLEVSKSSESEAGAECAHVVRRLQAVEFADHPSWSREHVHVHEILTQPCPSEHLDSHPGVFC